MEFVIILVRLDLLIMSFSALSMLFPLYFREPIDKYLNIPLLFPNLFNVPINPFYVPPISQHLRPLVSLDCSIA